MRALIAITKLTCKATLRSYVFHFLFLLLIAVIFILPNAIVSDGTARGLIRISLKYCLGVSGFILSLSTIWVSCFALSNDLETYQMHMLSVKPVSRIVIWIGKFLGVVVLHGVLLLLASLVIYGFTIFQFSRSDFSAEEKERIKNEVLVGRRVYMPEMPDFSVEVKSRFRQLMNAIESGATGAPEALSKDEKVRHLKEILRNLVAKYGEIPQGSIKTWEYKGLNPKREEPLSLRYRLYVGKVSSKDQRETYGIWSARAQIYENGEKPTQDGKPKYGMIAKSPYPERFMCGVFLEERISPAIVDSDGTAVMGFLNADQEGSPLFFQPGDGPKLLERRCSFLENYLRAVMMIFLRIILLAGLGASAGAIFSMPVAVFMVISYLLLGIATTFVVGVERDFGYDLEELEKF
ncbi:MAG TPA: hypothetical protein PK821_03855, partial [Victivallales bacterium]|nr:hypothetical protein [Victivallales bacterium]